MLNHEPKQKNFRPCGIPDYSLMRRVILRQMMPIVCCHLGYEFDFKIDYVLIFRFFFSSMLKFIYSEKAAEFCEIFTLLLTTVHTVKSKLKILQNFVAFSEYMNFI